MLCAGLVRFSKYARYVLFRFIAAFVPLDSPRRLLYVGTTVLPIYIFPLERVMDMPDEEFDRLVANYLRDFDTLDAVTKKLHYSELLGLIIRALAESAGRAKIDSPRCRRITKEIFH